MTDNMNIKITIEDHSEEVLKALENAIKRGLFAVGEEAETFAKENVAKAKRVDTGIMMNSINHREGENFTAIGTNVEYAIWHELGTGIYASDGKGRKSPWAFKDRNGKWHYTRGIKPIHFLHRAITEHLARYKEIIKDSLENA